MCYRITCVINITPVLSTLFFKEHEDKARYYAFFSSLLILIPSSHQIYLSGAYYQGPEKQLSWFVKNAVQLKQELCMPFNPLNSELNPICYLLALLGAHHFLHVSRIRVKSLTPRLLISYIYISIYIYIWSTYS